MNFEEFKEFMIRNYENTSIEKIEAEFKIYKKQQKKDLIRNIIRFILLNWFFAVIISAYLGYGNNNYFGWFILSFVFVLISYVLFECNSNNYYRI